MLKKFLSAIFLIFGFAIACFGQINKITENFPHWQNPSKLTVFIQQDTNSAMMKRAFLKWQNESYGKVKFVFTEKTPANINVTFTDKVDKTDAPLGSYSNTIKNGYITKSDIKIASINSKASKNMIYTTMLHEIGHSLGLPDTSRSVGIMNMPISESQDIYKRDVRQLYRIYDWNWVHK